MEKIEKFLLMDKMTRELEDLKNSQTSVIKKIGQLDTENINLGNTTLTKGLSEIYEHIDKNLKRVENLLESFSQETEDFKSKNNITDEAIALASQNVSARRSAYC